MNPKTQKNPRYRNGPPKVVDQTPQESLLPAGRPGLSEFPLEDRSDRLGDPPSTVFPAGEIALHPTPVEGPGPSGTAPRGRDDALDTLLLPEPSMSRLGIGVGRGQQTPDGYMTHRLLDPRRKQPRRAPGAGSNPLGTDGLGSDPHDHRQHQEPPRWTSHVVVAGRTPGKARGIHGYRLPPSGTPPEQPQGRRPGRLPQLGVTRCRMNPWNVQHPAPSGPQLGGTGPQVLQPPIVHSQILLHQQTRPQRRLGELLRRVLGPIGGQVLTGDLAVPAGQTSAVATVSWRLLSSGTPSWLPLHPKGFSTEQARFTNGSLYPPSVEKFSCSFSLLDGELCRTF
jgi:hypothetical protein